MWRHQMADRLGGAVGSSLAQARRYQATRAASSVARGEHGWAKRVRLCERRKWDEWDWEVGPMLCWSKPGAQWRCGGRDLWRWIIDEQWKSDGFEWELGCGRVKRTFGLQLGFG